MYAVAGDADCDVGDKSAVYGAECDVAMGGLCAAVGDDDVFDEFVVCVIVSGRQKI